MRVLLGAYACKPNAGTEPGHGWNWATHLSRLGMTVTVLTRKECRRDIEAYRAEHPELTIEFVYAGPDTDRFKVGSGIHYALWHWSSIKLAKALHKRNPFDIAHHVAYGSIHVPTQLWRTGVPTVFGPVGGGQVAPAELLPFFGRAARSEKLRSLMTKSLPYSPMHRLWMKKISRTLAVNKDTVDLARSIGGRDVRQMFDIAVAEEFVLAPPAPRPERSQGLKLLWVGRIVPRKGLTLALDVLAKVDSSISLTIVGQSWSESALREDIAKRGLTDRVHWSGRRMEWLEVREAYSKHDALFFTSMRETCGAQLLESMALGLPVICIDLHGAKELLSDKYAIKVPLEGLGNIVEKLAEAITRFAAMSTEERDAMSLAAWEMAQSNTWSQRAKAAIALYDELLGLVARESNPGRGNKWDIVSDRRASLD